MTTQNACSLTVNEIGGGKPGQVRVTVKNETEALGVSIRSSRRRKADTIKIV